MSTVPGYHTNTINCKELEAQQHWRHREGKDEVPSPLPANCKKYWMVYDPKYLNGLKILCGDKGKVSRMGRIVDQYIICHPNFGEEEIIVAIWMFTVLQEGETPFDDKVVIPILPPMDTGPTVQEHALGLLASHK